MMKVRGLLFCLVVQLSYSQDLPTANFKSFVEGKDFLGLRVYLRKQLKDKNLSVSNWQKYRGLIEENISAVGYDTLYSWDSKTPTGAETKRSMAIKDYLEKADNLMLKKNFAEAFKLYQSIAVSLKSDIDDRGNPKEESKNTPPQVKNSNSASLLYSNVLDAMGRSLYGMKRYRESAEVFEWIPSSYPKYRRVLFSQMWAWFRAGQVDQTLGRIAAQFSAYFTEFHYPEAYLVQAYVYKKLCRTEELNAVIKRMNTLNDDVISGVYTWKDWLRTDVEGLVLGKILDNKPKKESSLISTAERAGERSRIESAVNHAFQLEKPIWLESMVTAKAYALLSTGKGSALKGIDKLPSRETLFKNKLEVWPADKGEIWIDELGSHRFAGESQCAL